MILEVFSNLYDSMILRNETISTTSLLSNYSNLELMTHFNLVKNLLTVVSN